MEVLMSYRLFGYLGGIVTIARLGFFLQDL